MCMRHLALVLAAALLGSALLAPSASAAKSFGFNDNAAVYGLLTASKDAQLAQQAGADSSRITFDWRWAEPTEGVWDLAKYDAMYNANIAKGIRPVFILMFAPAWADGSTCAGDCKLPPDEAHMAAWRKAAVKLVQRYPQMAALEVWNEPNLDVFWQGGADPAAYTRLLTEAHSAVKAAGSNVPVLGGAIASIDVTVMPEKMDDREFLDGMYRAGAAGRMDGLSIHPYPHDMDLGIFYKMFSDVRDLQAIHGDSTPIWVSETGATTTQNSQMFWATENNQALLLRRLYNEMNAMADVRAIWFHTLVDPSNVPLTNPERGFGMMRSETTPKPAYCMFAALRRTTYKCPAKTAPLKADALQESRWTAQHYVQRALDAARRHRVATGSFAGLTTAKLNALDPGLSATEPVYDAVPGAAAEPTRVGVWVLGDAAAGNESVLVCNNSKADRSYCIQSEWGKSAVYGATASSIYGTAGAVTGGSSASW